MLAAFCNTYLTAIAILLPELDDWTYLLTVEGLH